MEDKDDTTKDAFYDKLEVLYNRRPRSDIKMLVGDFNAKVGDKVFLAQQSENTVYRRNQATMASDWYPSLPHKV